MKVKSLITEQFEIVGVMDGETCPVEQFLLEGEASTEAAREGLLRMLEKIAQVGLQQVPAAWSHEASKQLDIYEFKKGPLRLFYFKGKNGQIAVCTSGGRKSGPKADDAAVKKAARYRREYFEALENGTLITEREDGT